MEWIDKVMEQWNRFVKNVAPLGDKVRDVYLRVKVFCEPVLEFVRRMKKLVLAIPILFLSVVLAIYNLAKLPSLVGIFLQENGLYTYQIAKEIAVLTPLALTALCLMLMFISKRTLTPWLVSLFSLAVPLTILITNIFPA